MSSYSCCNHSQNQATTAKVEPNWKQKSGELEKDEKESTPTSTCGQALQNWVSEQNQCTVEELSLQYIYTQHARQTHARTLMSSGFFSQSAKTHNFTSNIFALFIRLLWKSFGWWALEFTFLFLLVCFPIFSTWGGVGGGVLYKPYRYMLMLCRLSIYRKKDCSTGSSSINTAKLLLWGCNILVWLSEFYLKCYRKYTNPLNDFGLVTATSDKGI